LPLVHPRRREIETVIPPGLLVLCLGFVPAQDGPPPLQDGLRNEDPASLARAVRDQGDPARGAIVYYRKHLACTTCHGDPGSDPPTLGPDLAKLGPGVTDAYLIESILEPSKSVKPGFEAITIATVDGRSITGLIAEDRPDRVVLRDPGEPGKIVTIPRAEIEQRKVVGTSLMPPGLANGLDDRRQFLDLVRYLREIADGGPARARALRPDPAQLAPPPLPDYEREIDHAGMIAGLGDPAFKRGAAIYERICASCHGTIDREGSMPTSLRFGSGRFKNGNDPYSMYRTLTLGFNQMPPQLGLVPRQKYDVIHYVREEFLKEDNRSQYFRPDPAYLAGLPKGQSRGPEPIVAEPWRLMDYGSTLMATIEVGKPEANFAYKGIAVRLDPGPGGIAAGRAFALYDHDTIRLEAIWTGAGFVDWNGINFNGRHEIHPRLVGHVEVANPPGPGWADPRDGRFDDPRLKGRDGRPYGPLPRTWARYKGLYHHGDRAILSYSVGDVDVLDETRLEHDGSRTLPIFARTLEIGPTSKELRLHVVPAEVRVAIVGDGGTSLVSEGGATRLRIPASPTPTLAKLLMWSGGREGIEYIARRLSPSPESLKPLTKGGPSRWPQRLTTRIIRGRDDGPFAVDTLAHPLQTPWASQMRFTGFDFTRDGKAAIVCDWDGDVWRVDGLDDLSGTLTWRRIASGLFQPLGLKIVDETIHVACRDQIAILRDQNGDGETDFVECFNSDHQVTEHFHEFAMDLQTDADGNFYYAKGARHGKTALVPQHGTLLRVSKDGSRTDILATGFRAPNGVCVNPDGTFFLTDQEGFWIPKNRINHVKIGGFYGNMWGYHDVTDPSDWAMEPPLCWITNAVDRSPAEVVRVEGHAWGPLRGALLNLSYGYGKIYVVPHETVNGRMQGGVSALPIPQFPTGVMRGRFHPGDGQLYACGMYAWAGNQQQPGGLYRVRATGKPMHLPIGLDARPDGMAITFTDPLDAEPAADASRFAVKTWSLRRSVKYGSPHVGEKPSAVRSARLSQDGKTVFLEIPGLLPTQCMEIKYTLKAKDGKPVVGSIDNTIHALGGSR
jgi:putative heme-binding domain-containing protein